MPRYQRRPPTAAEVELARSKRDQIIEKFKNGLPSKKIAMYMRLPIDAIEMVLIEAGLLQPKEGGDPYMGTIPKTTPPTPEKTAPAPSTMSGNNEQRSAVAGTATVPSQAQFVQPAAQREITQESEDPLSREFPNPPLPGINEVTAMIGAEQIKGFPEPSKELEGVFERPEIYKTLYYTLTEFGARPELARGIIRVFRYYEPQNYVALDEILRLAGISPGTRKIIIKSWKLATSEGSDVDELKDEEVEGIVEGKQPERAQIRERVEKLKKELGLGDTMLDTLEDLEREKLRIEIEEMKERLRQAREKKSTSPEDEETMEVVVKVNGMPMRKTIRVRDLPLWKPLLYNEGEEGGSDVVEVLLDINGVRVRKKIKMDEIEKWKPYIVREEPQNPAEMVDIVLNVGGMPVPMKVRKEDLPKYAPWMKPADEVQGKETKEVQALKEMIQQLNERMEKEKREYEERQREAQRRAELESLRNEISQLRNIIASGPKENEADKKYEELRQLIERQREEQHQLQMQNLQQTLEAYRSELQQLRNELNRVNNYEYAIQQEQRLRDLARKAGFVPKDEARRIEEEEIELQDRLNMVKRKDEAQAEALHIAADKLKTTGRLRDEVINKGGAEAVVDVLRRITTPPEQMNAKMYVPTPEELAKTVEQIQQQNSAQEPAVSPPATSFPQQNTAQQSAVPGYRPIVPEQPHETQEQG